MTLDSDGGLYSSGAADSYKLAAENGTSIEIYLESGYNAIGLDIGFLMDKTQAILLYTLIGETGVLSSDTSLGEPNEIIARSGSFYGWICDDDDIVSLEINVMIPYVSAWPTIDNLVYGNTAAPVPEPSTMLLLGSGILGIIGVTRRKIRK